MLYTTASVTNTNIAIIKDIETGRRRRSDQRSVFVFYRVSKFVSNAEFFLVLNVEYVLVVGNIFVRLTTRVNYLFNLANRFGVWVRKVVHSTLFHSSSLVRSPLTKVVNYPVTVMRRVDSCVSHSKDFFRTLITTCNHTYANRNYLFPNSECNEFPYFNNNQLLTNRNYAYNSFFDQTSDSAGNSNG